MLLNGEADRTLSHLRPWFTYCNSHTTSKQPITNNYLVKVDNAVIVKW